MKNYHHIAVFVDGIDQAGEVGRLLLPILEKQDANQKRNVIVLMFLRKTLRLLDGMKRLLMYHLDEEAEILVRALFETRVTFDYFLILAKQDYDETYRRYFDCMMLDKIRQIEALVHNIPDSDKDHWLNIKDQMDTTYSPDVLAAMKKHGFACLPLEERAIRSGNEKLFHLVHSTYSRNVHSTDVADQLTPSVPSDKMNGEFDDSAIGMMLNVASFCGRAVTTAANEWLGTPVDLTKFYLTKPSTAPANKEGST